MAAKVTPMPGCTMPPPFAPATFLWASYLWALRQAGRIQWSA